MTFSVKVVKWHAVASWTWNAGDDFAAFAGCRMMVALRKANTPATTALWCGGSAAMPSTCSAFRNGSLPRRSSAAPCAAGRGSSRPQTTPPPSSPLLTVGYLGPRTDAAPPTPRVPPVAAGSPSLWSVGYLGPMTDAAPPRVPPVAAGSPGGSV
eukprot:CAMPEP_0177587250 /NCGR_PEP_ID=MMETSP0419_2-20121207/5533_1 /TAXON_ID=582737 /ORGANISM="Tetraselmis sp., Strain GSL018" /LENGTH=153 /DNA_ID=CAMNT_0019077251 /DNA_START=551 /DNA_END=1010 /DNA_ORIENTATION=-